MEVKITDQVKYIGVDDITLDLFESQYSIPNGISYNSYVILDEKIAVMDTVDARGAKEWEEQLLKALNGRAADYLVIHHLEPDHAGAIGRFLELFPEAILVGNKKTFQMFPQFLDVDIEGKTLEVSEGDILSLGSHTLSFIMAPMVHWPEVMVSYDCKDKILFSADAFGKFGALSLTANEGWACEARRYYFNIVGKYGKQVQTLLKKLEKIDVEYICPLHGPVIWENLKAFVRLYHVWSSYEPENEGVFIACASIHGNTWKAAEVLRAQLLDLGVPKVVVSDLARDDLAEAVEDAFRYDRMVLAAASYDGGVVPCMETFLHHLKAKQYQKRKVGIVQNGSWAPSAGKAMKDILSGMKELEIVEPMVTICSTVKEEARTQLASLAVAMSNITM